MTTDQPSLEEARKPRNRLYDAARDYGSIGYDASKVRREIEEAFIRGAEFARAEVIREVEALDEKAWLAQRGMFGDLSEHDTDAAVTDLIDAVLTFTVRALSPGGEGKA